MKIPINTNVVKRHGLALDELLTLLLGYYHVNYADVLKRLEEKGLVLKDVFDSTGMVLSDNTMNLVAKILIESDEKLEKCSIKDFDGLAEKLQRCYPEGVKDNTTHPWRGDREEIAQKLRILVSRFNFDFTEREAIKATKEYVKSFKPPYKGMKLLRSFVLKTIKSVKGPSDIDSLFMTIIENNRETG